MDGKIIDENDKGVAIDVTDNNGAIHEISMFHDGEISYHDQDGYSDNPDQRTKDENEQVNQARRYAKYYVYEQREYDTVAHANNPDYVNAVREAIGALSDDEFEQYFRPLYQQLRSHEDDSVTQLVDLPAGVRAEDAVIYELDVYLGLDLEDSALEDHVAELTAAQGLDTEQAMTAQRPSDVAADDLQEWQAFGEQLVDVADPDDLSLEISAVSGIHVGYPDAAGEHQVQRAADPLDREPDTTLELMPYAPDTVAEFRDYLDHHLRCQIRDCFAGMGLYPPEPFRVTGFGKFIYARRYDHYDLYPPFHTADGTDNPLFG